MIRISFFTSFVCFVCSIFFQLLFCFCFYTRRRFFPLFFGLCLLLLSFFLSCCVILLLLFFSDNACLVTFDYVLCSLSRKCGEPVRVLCIFVAFDLPQMSKTLWFDYFITITMLPFGDCF